MLSLLASMESSKIKISIVTAAYNSAATITDTFTSVAEQSYQNVEHILIDGNSSDETLSLARSDGKHLAKVISEPDKGIYDAMNKGIAETSGDIVGILNSDDFYANNDVLSKVADAFKDPSVDCVYGDLYYVDPVDTSVIKRNWVSGEYKRASFLYGWMPPHPTFFVKKKHYDALGTYTLDLRSAADYELMLRFLYKHKLKAKYIPSVLVHMRDGGFSNSSLSHRWKANREDRRAWAMNDLNPRFYTIPMKPLRKLKQFKLS